MRQGISFTMVLAKIAATEVSVAAGVRAVVGSEPPSPRTPFEVGPRVEYVNVQNKRLPISNGCDGLGTHRGRAERFPVGFVASRSRGCVLKPRCKARHNFFQENTGCDPGRCPPALALPLFSR